MRNEIFKKMKKQNNVFGNLILGDYEQEIEDSIPNDYKPIYLSKKEKENFAKVAEKHELYQTSKRINIRIKNEDLIAIPDSRGISTGFCRTYPCCSGSSARLCRRICAATGQRACSWAAQILLRIPCRFSSGTTGGRRNAPLT